MCVIMHAKKKSLLTMEMLKDGHETNPDGWGIMFPKDGRIVQSKWYHTNRSKQWKAFEEVWKQVPDDAQVGVHFRIKTHGDKSVENSHPFEVLRFNPKKPKTTMDLWMMHNGTIPITATEKDDPRSDTAIFVDAVVKPHLLIHREFLDHSSYRLALRMMINGSRLLFMAGDGRHWIINEQSGDREGDLWFSNTYFKGHSKRQSSRSSTHWSHNNDYDGYGMYGAGNGWWQKERQRATKKNQEHIQLLKQILPPTWKEREPGVWQYKPGNVDLTANTQPKGKDTTVVHLPPPMSVLVASSTSTNALVQATRVANQKDEDRKSFLTQSIEDIELNWNSTEYKDKVAWVQRMTNDNFPTMNKSELLEWLSDYPISSADWMIRHGYSGGKYTVAAYILENSDQAVEWIYNRSRNLRQDDDGQIALAM